MNIQFVEAFWRSEEDGEYSARYTAKPFWSGFGDAWCWENDAVPLSVTLATIDEIDSLADQFALFRNSIGPGIMIIGAHGRDPEKGQRHLLIRNNQGKIVPVGWNDIRSMLNSAGNAPLSNKVLIIDSCSFCTNGKEARKTLEETKLGLICGFKKDIEPIDSMIFEIAFVNYLLWEWWDGERCFESSFLQRQEHLFGADFLKRYKRLSKELGFRIWRWTGEAVEEIILSSLLLPDERIKKSAAGQLKQDQLEMK
jgi:hypothetical protein